MEMEKIGAWQDLLGEEMEKPYFQALREKIRIARSQEEIYPERDAQFRALELTQPEQVRAVILGQDPYHEPGQAMGLAFSVMDGTKFPPSLRNIFQELETDQEIKMPASGDLTAWAKQGVLLLNTVLTVQKGKANSHAAWGWQEFTDAIIRSTNSLSQPIAFVLWGSQAQKKESLIDTQAPRLILKAPHPSPLSSYRGFFGSRPFSKINTFLQNNSARPIDWTL